MTVTTRPDRRELTHDRLFAQSAVITADSTGALSSAFPGAIPGEPNCKVRMRRSKTLWYVLGRDRFESTASAGRRMPHASPIDLPGPIPEDPLPSSAKGGGRW